MTMVNITARNKIKYHDVTLLHHASLWHIRRMTNLFNNLSPTAVCERIKRTRLARDVSQVVLARRVGVTQSAIANWESRQEFLPEVGQASKLADALGVDLEWIYRGKSDRLPADLLQKIIEGPPPIRKRRKKRT